MAGPSGQTSRLQLPYPVPDDTVDVPRDVQALADKLDPSTATFLQGTAGLRPLPSVPGRMYFATDTKEVSYDDGSSWTPVGLPTRAATFGPSGDVPLQTGVALGPISLTTRGGPITMTCSGFLHQLGTPAGTAYAADLAWQIDGVTVGGHAWYGIGVYNTIGSVAAHTALGVAAGVHSIRLFCASCVGGTWYWRNGYITAVEAP